MHRKSRPPNEGMMKQKTKGKQIQPPQLCAALPEEAGSCATTRPTDNPVHADALPPIRPTS